MDRERWRQIDTILKSALELPTAERDAFLARACGADEGLRREVESLIAHDQSDSFMPTRPLGVIAAAAEDLLARAGKRGSDAHVSSSPSIDEARFVPGTLLGERYRIVGLLGRGGMGEVYRADDLKLKQPVALKFLPEKLSADGASLARFYQEVSVARQISHRNVCRVYDVGESEGLHFISMEYVRGEELSSLMKRIGHLPQDKAVEIARQLCAGLAAIHEKGVLHRDLKPANVMLDEVGNVRITDFGLAGLAEELKGREAVAGTPAYMSPEQLEGRELTVRSDIYSLGLVIYEVFTGRRAFEAATLEDLLRLRATSSRPSSPSSLVKDLDPLVERVIERCLEQDSSKRPDSALKVAAALPGGDPIAAALAAGETPSPEMVAAAPKEGALRPVVAVSLLAAVVVGLALACLLSRDSSLYRLTPLEKSPEVLEARAQELVRKFGYSARPTDSETGMTVDEPYLNHVAEHDASPSRWERLRTGEPSVYYFWYRQSPRYLFMPTIYRISFSEPAWDVAGMAGAVLDSGGRLRRFVAVPPQRDDGQEAAPAPDWAALFGEAGLDPSKFQETEPRWVPPHASDARKAWEGTYTSARPGERVRVEAAAYRGRPVYFEVINEWDQPEREVEPRGTASQRALSTVVLTLIVVALATGTLLAFRNLRLGRGDRRGATRLAVYVFAARLLLEWVFVAHHFASPGEEFVAFIEHLKSSVFTGAFIWVMYMALEPLVRRRWPERIISWSRVMAGGWRDPLVGRDILVGAALGVAFILCAYLSYLVPMWLGYAPRVPIYPDTPRMGAEGFAYSLASQIYASVTNSFVMLLLLLLFYLVTRRTWLAAVLEWLLLFGMSMLAFGAEPASLPFVAALPFIMVFVLYRYGLLATASFMTLVHLWVFFPVTSDLSAWYARGFVIDAVLCLALVAYGFYTSLAGQRLFSGKLLED